MSCPDYYDLKILKASRLPIDSLIKIKVSPSFAHESRIWKTMKDVTPSLIEAYERYGKEHIQLIRENRDEYGYLYFVSEHSSEWYNAPHFDYAQFPLMRQRGEVLKRIQKIAKTFAKENTTEFDATCLYLLYFFALLVNPTLNWTIIDYLSNGNRYHSYGTRLKGKMTVTEKKLWI